MRAITYVLGTVAALAGLLIYEARAAGDADGVAAPIFGIKIPP